MDNTKATNPMKIVAELQNHIYGSMTAAEKWKQICELRETAWLMKRAGVKACHPDWSEEKIETEVRRIFLIATT